MHQTIPISASQYVLIEEHERNVRVAEHALAMIYKTILAGADISSGHVTAADKTNLTLTVALPAETAA